MVLFRALQQNNSNNNHHIQIESIHLWTKIYMGEHLQTVPFPNKEQQPEPNFGEPFCSPYKKKNHSPPPPKKQESFCPPCSGTVDSYEYPYQLLHIPVLYNEVVTVLYRYEYQIL